MSTNVRQTRVPAMAANAVPGRFRTLQYQPLPGERWYHVLFGHVPRFQMEFILRPEMPCRKFRPQHFAHLGPQIKFLSPVPGQTAAFAIGNLSSNDTQHIPGRGGISLLVSTRVAELRDHAQRESPVFVHGLITVDELLVEATLAQTMGMFLQHVLQEGQSFYRGYYISGQADNLERVQTYTRSLRGLPAPDDAGLPAATADVFVQYLRDGVPPYNQILIDCRQLDLPGVLALMARLAVLLYRSNLKWSTVTTGSEPFEPRLHQGADFGVSVRLLCEGVPDDVIERHLRDAPPPSKAVFIGQDDLPKEDEQLAAQLFGASMLRPTSAALPLRDGADSPDGPWQPLSSVAGHPAPRDHAHSLDGEATLAFTTHAGSDAAQSGSKDTERDLPAVAPQIEPPLSQPALHRETADRLGQTSRHVAASTTVGSQPRPALWLSGGLLFGAAVGALAMWHGLGQPVSSRPHSTPPSVGGLPAQRFSAKPVPTDSAQPSPPTPSVEPTDWAEPQAQNSESLEARQALAKAIQPQASLFSTQAKFLQASLARQRSTGGALTKPYQVLARSADKLQTAVEQLNHVATAITLDGSVYRLLRLTDSYCDARVAAQQAKAAASPFNLDIPSDERRSVASKP